MLGRWGGGWGGGGWRRISVASSFDLLLLKLSGYEAFLPDHPTSFKSISCQFCSPFYTFSSSLYFDFFIAFVVVVAVVSFLISSFLVPISAYFC